MIQGMAKTVALVMRLLCGAGFGCAGIIAQRRARRKQDLYGYIWGVGIFVVGAMMLLTCHA